jgi:hypothetical protein
MNLIKSSVLLEGITHLEDLPISEFIRAVETLKDKTITEKLDGANLWFGIDEDGLFTSREGKGSKQGRFRSVDDYARTANYNGFRGAHAALERLEKQIAAHLEPGDIIEIEVLFGSQPNTVVYGAQDKNFIVLLRGIDTPSERVDALSAALKGKNLSVESLVISSPDGEELQYDDVVQRWEVTTVEPVSTRTIDTKAAIEILDKLKKFLGQQNDVVPGSTNAQVAEISLTSVPKESRPEVKKERERLSGLIMSQYKLPIKDSLLDVFVRKLKPFLQKSELHPSEDIGIEGVVARDGDEQIKIVDKDVFTTINSFNSSVRGDISGLVKTTDPDSPLSSRGGAFGKAKIEIADLLGIKDLALSSGTKRIVSKFKGATATDTLTALAKSINIPNVSPTASKINNILDDALSQINNLLDSFREEAGEYRLKLKTGKEIGLSPEIMRRTLTAFAETKQEISVLQRKISKSKTAEDLLNALYGKSIEAIHAGESMKESLSLLKSIIEDEGTTSAAAVGGEAGGTTTSGNIAPVEKRLFGNKLIVRRPRRFQLSKKFVAPPTVAVPAVKESVKWALLKSLSEDLMTDMEFTKNVDDTVGAKNDVSFRSLRNTVVVGNDDLTSIDVHQYLRKAHEINDEVDTVAFGLEDSSGNIVKVYVSVDHADKFEEALSQKLGDESDVETAINDLAASFDIVDVEWPKEMKGDAPVISSDDKEEIEDAETTADLEVPEAPADIESEEDESEESEEDESDEDDEDSDESTEDEEDEDESDEDSDDESKDKSDEDDEDESDEEDTSQRKEKKESTMQTYGQRFKQKLLAEAEAVMPVEKEKAESEVEAAAQSLRKQEQDFIDSFPKASMKAVVALMIALGAPVKYLKLHKADVRSSIEDASDMYAKSSTMKMWSKKLLTALANSGAMTEGVDFEKRFSTKYQKLIFEIMRHLGLPESIERAASRVLIKNIKDRAKLASGHSDIRLYLMSLAHALGVDDTVRNMSEPKMAESVEEDIAEADDKKQELEMDLASQVLKVILTGLGWDDKQTKTSIDHWLANAKVKQKLNRLQKFPNAMARLRIAAQIINDEIADIIPPGKEHEIEFQHEVKKGAVVSEGKETKWNVGTLGKKK